MPTAARIRNDYLRREHTSGWTIVGWLLGAAAIALATVFLFIIEVTTSVTETTDAATGQITRTTVREVAWGRDGALGLVIPLVIALVVWVIYAFAKGLGRPWHRVVALIAAFIAGGLLWDQLKDVAWGDIEWELALLGLAAAAVILVSIWLAHVFYVNNRREIDAALNKNQAWIDRCEAELRNRGVTDLSTIPDLT